MKLRKEQFFFLSYDKKTALTAAIILSFVLAFILLSSSIYAISIDSKNMRIAELISIKSVISLLLNTPFLLSVSISVLGYYTIRKQPIQDVDNAGIAVSYCCHFQPGVF